MWKVRVPNVFLSFWGGLISLAIKMCEIMK